MKIDGNAKSFQFIACVCLAIMAGVASMGFMWLDSFEENEVIPIQITVLGPILSAYLLFQSPNVLTYSIFIIGAILFIVTAFFIMSKKPPLSYFLAGMAILIWWAIGYVIFSIAFYG